MNNNNHTLNMARGKNIQVGDIIRDVEILAINDESKTVSLKCDNNHIFDVPYEKLKNYKYDKRIINPPCTLCRDEGHFEGTSNSKYYKLFKPIFEKYETPRYMWKYYTKDYSQYHTRITEVEHIKILNNTLTLEDFFKLVSSPKCYWCGQTELKNYEFKNGGVRPKLLGIDRKDNSLGYTLDNCVPSCSVCNYMKNTFAEKLFLNKVFAITDIHLDEFSEHQLKHLFEHLKSHLIQV